MRILKSIKKAINYLGDTTYVRGAKYLMGAQYMGANRTTLKYNEKTRQWRKTTIPNLPTKLVANVINPSYTMCLYEGKLVGGKPSGYGVLEIYPDSFSYSTTYHGEWKDGRYHGNGKLITIFSSHSREYDGQFKDGLKHGYGRKLAWRQL